MVCNAGVLYLLQAREFRVSGAPVFKLGRTSCERQLVRPTQYGKDTLLHFVMPVGDHVAAEAAALETFRLRFTQRRDIGVEYFEGDLSEMRQLLLDMEASFPFSDPMCMVTKPPKEAFLEFLEFENKYGPGSDPTEVYRDFNDHMARQGQTRVCVTFDEFVRLFTAEFLGGEAMHLLPVAERFIETMTSKEDNGFVKKTAIERSFTAFLATLDTPGNYKKRLQHRVLRTALAKHGFAYQTEHAANGSRIYDVYMGLVVKDQSNDSDSASAAS
jgi:hypothetical protein